MNIAKNYRFGYIYIYIYIYIYVCECVLFNMIRSI